MKSLPTRRAPPWMAALVTAIAAASGAIALPPAAHAQTDPAAAAQTKGAKPARPALSVSVVRPEAAELAVQLAANGSVAAWQEAIIGAEINGLRLASIHADIGDRVKRGEVLAEFAAESVEAELAQARASLAEAEANAYDAKANAERARSVQASGALSAQQVAQYLTAEKTADARLAAARAQLDQQQLRLKHTRVVASDDGVISARSATLGAVAAPGQELFRLIRRNRLEWRAEVTAAELARIRPGQKVRISAAGAGSAIGRVRSVAPTVDAQTRNALVYVDLPDAATPAGQARGKPDAAVFTHQLKPGMFAHGEFDLGRSSGLTLPQQAIALRDGFSYVYVVGADQRVAQIKVQTGRRSGDRVEVLSGVRPEQDIVAGGASFLSDGDTVKVVAAAGAPRGPAPGPVPHPGAAGAGK
jgi:RND family efflux transporter MFP subunit